MAANQEAAWNTPSAFLRDPANISSTLSRACRNLDSVVPINLLVVADVDGLNHYHLGDEAMLEVNLQRLRELNPSIGLTVITSDPGWAADRYCVRAVSRPELPYGHSADSLLADWAATANPVVLAQNLLGSDLCQVIRESSGLLISGGGNISSTWPDKILERIALIEYAIHLSKPVALVGQTLGPQLGKQQFAALSRCLPRCDWVGVREQDSAAIALNLGAAPDRVHVQLDDAYFLDPVKVQDDRAKLLSGAEPLIVVSLDASFQTSARGTVVTSIASQLDAIATYLNAKLVFLPNVGGPGAGDPLSDDMAAAVLASALRSNLIRLGRWEPAEARWLIQQAAMVISTRYHPVVFASASCTPALAIYTDQYTRTKLRGALSPSKLTGWCLSVDEAGRGSLLPLMMELWHKRYDVSERMRESCFSSWPAERDRWSMLSGVLGTAPLRLNELPTPRALKRQNYSAASNQAEQARSPLITEEQWQDYQQNGYLRLGKLLSESQLQLLQGRVDGIMLGTVTYPNVQMQLDTGGKYEELPDPEARHLAKTLTYRKLQGLEADPDILAAIRNDVFRQICGWHYGKHASISIFRVMMMNKPAGKGTYLPWHQDAGDVWKLDRDPLVTTWIALDPATKANGCVQVIPGTHRLGLLSKNGSNISSEHEKMYCPPEKIEYLELEAGEVLLLHNWLLHRSDINQTQRARRALSVCYMDGRTLNVLSGARFPIVFGEHEDTETAFPFLRNVKNECQQLREATADAQQYSGSLLAHNRVREAQQQEAGIYVESLLADNREREKMRLESERYAQSLETELHKLRAVAASSGTE